MIRPIHLLAGWAIAIAALGVATSAAPATAADGSPVTTAVVSDDAWSSAGLAPGRLSVIVRLEGAPVWRVAAAAQKRGQPLAKDRLQSVRRELARRQLPTVRAVEGLGAAVVGRMQGTLNAIHVHCTPDQLAAIAQLPGVVSISKAPIHTIDNVDVRPFTGASAVAQQLGFDGTDVTIAIIDSGIDYTHKDFGGSGDPAEFAANDPDTTDDGGFPTAKVIGGYDLAGAHYHPGCPQQTETCWQTPQPDDDPIDGNVDPNGKHGTHVAGTAAGIGTDKVGAGTAPGANLVAIKVFGAPAGMQGSTDLTIEALEWIYNHNTNLGDAEADVPGHRPGVLIDVINMSLGSNYGGGTAEYAEVVAGLHQAGVTVVASAGNAGNMPYITGSPSSTEMILSVANTFASGEFERLFRAKWTEGGQAKQLETGYLADTGWLPAVTTPLVDKPMAYFGKGCGTNPAEPFQDVNEKVALIERGDCAFTDKVRAAQSKGAVAVVIFTGATAKVPMGPSGNPPYPTIPAVIIDRDKGLAIQTLLQNGTPVSATIDPTVKVPLPWLADTISGSSSRGPSRATGSIKPNISAPGENTFSALAGSGTDGVSFSGTSMSGPAVAGIVALLAQRNKAQELGMSAADLAALAMNYAHPVIRLDRNDTGPLVGVTRQGAGRVDALAAAKGSVVVRSDRGLAEFSLGDVNVTDNLSAITRQMTVRNLTDTTKHYRLSSVFAFPDEDAGKGLAVDLPDDILTVEGGDEVPVTVVFNVTPGQLRPWDLAGLDGLSAAKEAAFRTHEIDGYIQLTETDAAGAAVDGGEVVGLPFHALPHRRACVRATTDDPVTLADTTTEVDQRYEHPCQLPGQMFAAYLGGVDAAESATAGSDMPAPIDIGAVGVNAGVVTASDGTALPIVQFTLTTHGPRRTPSPLGYFVYIDADLDGAWDRVIFPYPENAANATAPAGRFLVAWAGVDPTNLQPTGQLSAAFLQSYDFGESVTTLAVPATNVMPGSDIGAGTLRFRYAVALRDQYEDFPQTTKWLGDDMAPDGLADGDGYVFDLAQQGCLQAKDPTNPSLDLFSPGVGIPSFPGGAQSLSKLSNRCEGVDEPIETGILSIFRTNMPSQASWHARPVTIGRGGGRIYLPYLSHMHTFEGYAVPTPEPPTAEAPTAEAPTLEPPTPEPATPMP